MWTGKRFPGSRLVSRLLLLCVCSALVFSPVFVHAEEWKPISTSELESILAECKELRTELSLSQTNLSQSETKQATLEQGLQTKQQRIDDLLQKSETLEANSALSEADSKTLSGQLAELKTSFERYKADVQSKLRGLEIRNVLITTGVFLAGAAIGAGIVLVVKAK